MRACWKFEQISTFFIFFSLLLFSQRGLPTRLYCNIQREYLSIDSNIKWKSLNNIFLNTIEILLLLLLYTHSAVWKQTIWEQNKSMETTHRINFSALKKTCFLKSMLLLKILIQWHSNIFNILNIWMMLNKCIIQWFWLNVTIWSPIFEQIN